MQSKSRASSARSARSSARCHVARCRSRNWLRATRRATARRRGRPPRCARGASERHRAGAATDARTREARTPATTRAVQVQVQQQQNHHHHHQQQQQRRHVSATRVTGGRHDSVARALRRMRFGSRSRACVRAACSCCLSWWFASSSSSTYDHRRGEVRYHRSI